MITIAKYSFLFVCLLVFCFITLSCTSQPSHKGKRELVPHPEKYEHDGYSEFANSINFVPDTSIAIISLNNSNNVNSYLGIDVMDNLVEKTLPYSSIISSNSKQRLTFYFHYGGSKNEFSEFKVSYVQMIKRNENKVVHKEFVTESGIKLGISIGELLSLKGEPKEITINGTSTYHYEINDYNNSKFLKHYKMPIYYANFTFENSYLIEFEFGFEYP